ncbi:MAG TPA: adenosylmethionine decarboxylase [Steroidobacter sp.]|uniref:adenosylmethionine decarboxylase n=1 Tax=Steroidobacter sp. TaxID=1978227 RepID=UPI002EDACF8C
MRAGSVLELNLLRQETAATTARAASAEAVNNSTWITERAGVRCAGAHMIIDLYGASRLDEIALIEQTLRRCVAAAGATLLHIHLHHFEPNGGVSGVAVLAESHISIHSWPERNYAALDIFMCGKARPERCIEVLLETFTPKRAEIQELLRGRLNDQVG